MHSLVGGGSLSDASLRSSPRPPLQHSELPKDLQQLQTPFEFYMKDTLDVRRCPAAG